MIAHIVLAAALLAAPYANKSTVASQRDPVIAAAGDIACDPWGNLDRMLTPLLGWCRMGDTAHLIEAHRVDAVLALGDEQYQNATSDAFAHGYALSWGAFKDRTYPTPGNHEYYVPEAAGYFGYFGARAGKVMNGYYSFTLGAWHIVSLNGNCEFVGGCDKGSQQERWLRADLAAHKSTCTLAFWHQPRFSSGGHGSDARYVPFWEDLYAAHADVVLAGHDHDYERFAPQTANGVLDSAHGIREFVVGTGGKSHDLFSWTAANSRKREWSAFGVLFMKLHQNGYDWRFVPIRGDTFVDAGRAPCHGRP